MTPPPPILYADDDENDAFLMQRAFRQAAIANPLINVADGQFAIEYLVGAKSGTASPLPALVLLDLKMPRKSGFDVLGWMRAEVTTAQIPALIISSSNQESDIHRAYTMGANCYLIKPGKPTDLLAIVVGIKKFWLDRTGQPES
jgi:CheY-like chemotaxis protein